MSNNNEQRTYENLSHDDGEMATAAQQQRHDKFMLRWFVNIESREQFTWLVGLARQEWLLLCISMAGLVISSAINLG